MSSWLTHPWTLWTAPLVHLSAAHALSNIFALVALLAIAALGGGRSLLRRYLIGLLVAWPLSTLSLLLCPEVTSYVGLSGLGHAATALLALLLLAMAFKSSAAGYFSASTLVGGCLLAGLLAKLWQEQAWVQPVVWSADWGFNVVVVAHLYGAGVGLVVGAAMLRLKPQPESV